MVDNSSIRENLQNIKENIARACHDSLQNQPGSITLVAVSKRQPLVAIEAAFDCGVRDFGENFVQEAADKIAAFDDAGKCNWHLIGPLQSNKAAAAAKSFSWVHTVDRLKIARRLSEARVEQGKPALNACVQVNLGGERSKSGLAPDEVPDFVAESAKLPGIVIRGLMCIPEADLDEAGTKARFEELRDLHRSLSKRLPNFDTLSMGMSADYPLAIEKGATMIRIGTSLFGPRTA